MAKNQSAPPAVIRLCREIWEAIQKWWSNKINGRKGDLRVKKLRFGTDTTTVGFGYQFQSVGGKKPTDVQQRELDGLLKSIKEIFSVDFIIEKDPKGKCIVWKLPLSAVPVS